MRPLSLPPPPLSYGATGSLGGDASDHVIDLSSIHDQIFPILISIYLGCPPLTFVLICFNCYFCLFPSPPSDHSPPPFLVEGGGRRREGKGGPSALLDILRAISKGGALSAVDPLKGKEHWPSIETYCQFRACLAITVERSVHREPRSQLR